VSHLEEKKNEGQLLIHPKVKTLLYREKSIKIKVGNFKNFFIENIENNGEALPGNLMLDGNT
jgi:hypothetical protein